MFSHLCSASASVSCCGLTSDTRSRPGLFSLREPTEGAVGNGEQWGNVLTGNGNGLLVGQCGGTAGGLFEWVGCREDGMGAVSSCSSVAP